jgi:ribulose-5-phosphate 4-epimerase/fuculose-1-phosphate aldolase
MSGRDETELREKLVDAGHILDHEGQGDYCMGHVTVRTPDAPGHILMKAGAMGFDEMTPGNIVTIDIEGKKTAGGPRLVSPPEEARAKKRISRPENQVNLFNYMARRVRRARGEDVPPL